MGQQQSKPNNNTYKHVTHQIFDFDQPNNYTQALIHDQFTYNLQHNSNMPNTIQINTQNNTNYIPVNYPVHLPSEYYETEVGTLNLQNLQINDQQQIIPQYMDSQNKQKTKKQISLLNYMDVSAVKAFQAFAQNVRFGGISQDSFQAQQAQNVGQKLIKNVLLENPNVRRNKTFLLMVLNPVNDKLNKKIQAKKMTKAHENYFNILQTYGPTIMNLAKKQLRFAFRTYMKDSVIADFAQNKTSFKVDSEQKKQILSNYLMVMRFQMTEYDKISGNIYQTLRFHLINHNQ